jgi:ABC-2 type transport system ATP-binding protein
VIVGEVSEGSDAFSFYTTVQEDAPLGDAMNSLRNEGIQITDFSLGRPSLDEVFLSLTGSGADEQRREQKHKQPKEGVRA